MQNNNDQIFKNPTNTTKPVVNSNRNNSPNSSSSNPIFAQSKNIAIDNQTDVSNELNLQSQQQNDISQNSLNTQTNVVNNSTNPLPSNNLNQLTNSSDSLATNNISQKIFDHLDNLTDISNQNSPLQPSDDDLLLKTQSLAENLNINESQLDDNLHISQPANPNLLNIQNSTDSPNQDTTFNSETTNSSTPLSPPTSPLINSDQSNLPSSSSSNPIFVHSKNITIDNQTDVQNELDLQSQQQNDISQNSLNTQTNVVNNSTNPLPSDNLNQLTNSLDSLTPLPPPTSPLTTSSPIKNTDNITQNDNPVNENQETDFTYPDDVKITNIQAREILDSRGVPTVEVIVYLNNGFSTISSISTTTNKNELEVLQLRDQDSNRMLGLGVSKAVQNVCEIITPKLIGLNPLDQEKIDIILLELDGTKRVSKLGSNATMAVSQAVLKAGAVSLTLPTYYYIYKKYQLCQRLSMPIFLYGLIDGGKHGSKNNIDFQEFQIIPANNIPFNKSLEMSVSIFNNLKRILVEKGAACSVGPSGGYTPNLFKNTDAFDLLIEAIKDSGFNIGRDVFFGIDVDGTYLATKNKYKIRDFPQMIGTKEMIEYYKKLNSLYGLYVIEDPFSKDDDDSWLEISKEMGEVIRIVGDNNLAANKNRVLRAIKKKLCNTALIKTGQSSTITEMFEIAQIVKQAGWQVVVANREGETNDDLIADIAVGIGANFAKFGPPNRGERIAKYNRLSQIYREIIKLDQK